MSSARQRQLVLLVLATTLLLAVVVPGMSGAQDATPGAESSAADLIVRGEELYNQTCIACHQPGGVGVTDVAIGGYPALAGNPFVTLDDPTPLVQVLITGRAGMPNFRGFSDEEIAGVASYIRQAWGNEAGPVDPALVAEVRAQYVVTPQPDATPITTEIPGVPVSDDAAATPSGDESAAQASPDVEGGAVPAGVTPIPTIGQ